MNQMVGRWFTPATEVVLCGHATLASGHVLIDTARETGRIRFRTRKAGMLEVARDGDRYAMSLPNWKPEPKPLPRILAALGIEAHPSWSSQEISSALVTTADPAKVAGYSVSRQARERVHPRVGPRDRTAPPRSGRGA